MIHTGAKPLSMIRIQKVNKLVECHIDPQLFRAEGRGEDWDTFSRLLAEQPLPVAGIDTLVQQAKENPEQTDRIESQLRRKAGNVLMQQYYPQLRRISIVVHCSDGVK